MTIYQVYAFCEGIWRSPSWVMAVDLTPKGRKGVLRVETSHLA